MLLRELNLNELSEIHQLISLEIDISYDDFENFVYEMRDQNYKMFGIFEDELLLCFSSISILNSIELQRHVIIHEMITHPSYRTKCYDREMFTYLFDYSKILKCKNIILGLSKTFNKVDEFFILREFNKESTVYIREI
jgi:hypothetical protein